MVGGRIVINDELRLLIYMAASRALAAFTFSHFMCRLDMLQVIQNLKLSLNDIITFLDF